MKSGESVVENPAQYFYVNNGSVLKSLNDLLNELKRIDNSTFEHHVNSEKNDFSNWTRDVLKEATLAKKIASAKSTDEIIKTLEKKIGVKSSPTKKAGKKSKKSVISQIKDSVGHG